MPRSIGGNLIRNRWVCSVCMKSLCSKRSYDEHMNIHRNLRPFTCDKCDYAAASEMTLRRHILRNHIPKQHWGYQCPYCTESFMEPASYQQHVMTRHFGRSATYGCPHCECPFTTKCARHFKDHLNKHIDMLHILRPNECHLPTTSFASKVYRPQTSRNAQLAMKIAENKGLWKFMVDDELGSGYGKEPLEVPPFKNKWVERAAKDVEEMFGSELAEKTKLLIRRPVQRPKPVLMPNLKPATRLKLKVERSRNIIKIHRASPPPDVALEVVVDASEGMPKRLPDGQIELDLD